MRPGAADSLSAILQGRTLVVRADSTVRIGTGHLLRCFALVEGWCHRGGEAVFLTHCESEALRRRLERPGVRLVDLEHVHPHPDDQETTLRLLNQFGHGPTPWLVLDGYHFDAAYQERVRRAGYPLLVIDDTAGLDRYHANVILNQNTGAEGRAYHCDPDTTLLLGPRFVLLRREFLTLASRPKVIEPSARRVLVTMGGSDPDNVSLRVIEALERLGRSDLEVRIVIGPANRHRASLQRVAGRFELLEKVENVPGLMAWADVAVSASGISCWELAFLGVPMALLVLADNQRASAVGMAEAGAALLLGEASQLDPVALAERLRPLLDDPDRRRGLSDRARKVVDGGGVDRVMAALG